MPKLLATFVIIGALANLAQWITTADGPLQRSLDYVTDATTWASVLTAAALLLNVGSAFSLVMGKRFPSTLLARLFRINR